MFKELFSNRLFIGVLAFFVLCVAGSLLYMQHVKRQDAANLAETRERIKQWDAARKTPAPVADTSQGGHWQGDEWHAEPHAASTASKQTAQTGKNVVSSLTESEIKALYRQLGKELAEMSPEEIDKEGPDLSQYSPKQVNYLYKRGINLALLPQNVQDKLDAHDWRKKGVEPPPPGYTYLQKEDGTYFLHKEGEPLIDVHNDAQGNVTHATFSFMGEANGRDVDEITREVAKKAWERMEAEKAKAMPER